MQPPPNQWQPNGQQPPQGYPPQYPPQQPPRRPRRRRLLLVLIALIAVLALCILGITLIVTLSPAQTAAPTATSAPTHGAAATAKPTAQPTHAPAVSRTIPATHGIPHLGGPLSDFIGAYGQPNGHSSPPSYHFMTVNNIDEYIILGLGTSCPSEQCIAQQQVDDISVQSPDQNAGFTPSNAEGRCMSYAPSDAHFKQKFVYADGSGYDMVYTSASLAHLFPASEFTDSSGGTAPAGTFDVSYLYADNGQGIGSCDMITGEQQTTG